MERRASTPALWSLPGPFSREAQRRLPDAVYRDLVATLFTMTAPIVGFGIVYAIVGLLIYHSSDDPVILALVAVCGFTTAWRVIIIKGYRRAGGPRQTTAAIEKWERHYAALTYGMAALLAAINLQALTIHQPLVHLATVSLIFTFGAGVVSRNASRPRLCLLAQTISVAPVTFGMFLHALLLSDQPLHAQFFALEAILLLVVGIMSIGSVKHLYQSAVEHLTTKHDLEHLARFDPLTGLANRLMLREMFQLRVAAANPSNQVAIHYLDLDGFKAINDQYGHPTGDQLLKEVASRLLATLRSDDLVARLGGDEFLIIQPDVRHADQAELLARRVIRQLSEAVLIDGKEMRISTSIGVALCPTHGVDLENLMRCADAALYKAKIRGKAQVQFCSDEDLDACGRAVA